MAKIIRSNLPIHAFIIITILAYVSMPFSSSLAKILFMLGGSSGYIAFGIFSAAVVPVPVGTLCFAWSVLFPIALTISYILACKTQSVSFCVVTIVDFGVVLGYTLYTIGAKDTYGFQSVILDLFLSFLMLILIVGATYLSHKESMR